MDFSFTSEGPKDKVKKVVRFTKMVEDLYNLGFGDLDEATGEINDTVVTNNSDSIKVLTTVAAIVHDFSNRYPKVLIFLKGNTQSRTRLYRRGITNHLSVISAVFEVQGEMDGLWEPFCSNRNYSAFLVHRKKM